MAAAAEDLRTQLVELLGKASDGMFDSDLKAHFGEEGFSALAPILNEFLQQSRITIAKLDRGILFRLVEEEIAEKLQGLSPEMMMVYEEIKNAGNNGIWNRDIKTNTNVQQAPLGKALKELEKRMLIKAVKSIHQKTKKIWMLFHLEPSVDITGGPWYTDNEFDHEFVDLIAGAVERQIRDAWDRDGRPTSLQMVDKYIKNSGVSREQLTTEQIRQVLDRLKFDARIEIITIPAGKRKQFMDPGPYYRSLRTTVTHYDRFTSVPCGVCPVFAQCAPGGVISPESCVYFEDWWQDPPEEEMTPAALLSEPADQMF